MKKMSDGRDTFSDYAMMGLVGSFVGAAFLVTLPVTVPLYLIGRFIVAPIVDRWL